MDNSTLDPKAADLRRFEVITGAGRRRRWPLEAKARIVAETLEPGSSVSIVARRHDLNANLLFTWRRKMASASDAERDTMRLCFGGGQISHGKQEMPRNSETIRRPTTPNC